MREVFYTTWDERQALVATAEALGEVMLHDEFRAEGKVLTFGDRPPEPVIVPTARELRLKELRVELGADRITLAGIREILRLERNL